MVRHPGISLICLWCLVCGCSQSSSQRGVLPAPITGTGNACDRRVLTQADVAGILSSPIAAAKVIPGDTQSCIFETIGFPSITVSVRPGIGRERVNTWLAGKMPLQAIALQGVGDSAAWQPDLHEVIAQRDDVLCDIQASGASGDFKGDAAELQQRLGALCEKIFAHLRRPMPG